MMHLSQCLIKTFLKYHRRAVDVALIRYKHKSGHPTAGIIVIGNEVLKAQVKDTNSNYACSLLYIHGIKVQKISVVQDNVRDIAEEVRNFSRKYDYIFTSGGIGPTHDDVTFEAVALAFDDVLCYHPKLMDIVKNCFGNKQFPSPGYKMAYVPTKSVLKFGKNEMTGEPLAYPCVVVENVHIFPGSPMFFTSSFQALCKESFSGYENFTKSEIFLNAEEESFANILNAVVEEFPGVTFGSYPERNRYYKVRVTIESETEQDADAARKVLCGRLPGNVLVDYDRTPHVDCLQKYEKLLEHSPRRSVYQNTFEKFLHYYQKPETVWIYLDGSEESIVMIHFARIVNSKLQGNSVKQLQAICFKFDDSQPDMYRFIRDINDRYDVGLYSLGWYEADVSQAFERFIAPLPQQPILLLGKRLTGSEREIYKNIFEFSKNRSGVGVQVDSPLIDWTAEDVKSFTSSLSLPYCAKKFRAVI